jgi:hypothetical protein
MRKKVKVKKSSGYYKIVGSGKLDVLFVKIGILSGSSSSIGNVRNLEDGLSLIRSHSGSEISSISDI